jgi:hypothetical protein
MPQVAALAEDHVARDFIAVPLELLQREAKLDFDLYLHGPTQMVLYREQHQAFSTTVLQRLTDNGISTLWVKGADERVLGQHIEAHLDQILSDPTVPAHQKATALYTSSRSLAMELLVSPDDEKLQRTRPLVAKTVSAVVGEPRVLSALIAALSTRYQLHTHCVNVSVYATAFARQLGYRELPVLTEIALGGLLHDLGKARIPERFCRSGRRWTNGRRRSCTCTRNGGWSCCTACNANSDTPARRFSPTTSIGTGAAIRPAWSATRFRSRRASWPS